MSLDGQSIMMIENNDEDKMRVVVLIDTITLNKTSEFPVSVFNDTHGETEEINETLDLYSPNEVNTCKTDYNFPKFVCWGQGKYVMVGIGVAPKSKVYYEFRIYDADNKRLIQTIYRTNKPSLTGLVKEVNNHPDSDEKLIFIVKDQITTFNLVELDIVSGRVKETTSINAHDISHLKIAEDLSAVFLIKYEKKYASSYTGTNKIYALQYGRDYNLTIDESTEPIGDLGQNIMNTQVLGNSLLVNYLLSDQTEMIEIFNESDSYKVKSDFTIYSAQDYTFDNDSKQILS